MMLLSYNICHLANNFYHTIVLSWSTTKTKGSFSCSLLKAVHNPTELLTLRSRSGPPPQHHLLHSELTLWGSSHYILAAGWLLWKFPVAEPPGWPDWWLSSLSCLYRVIGVLLMSHPDFGPSSWACGLVVSQTYVSPLRDPSYSCRAPECFRVLRAAGKELRIKRLARNIKKRVVLAGLTAAKKLVATCWKPPYSPSFFLFGHYLYGTINGRNEWCQCKYTYWFV